jgi:hypothetical protein
MSSIRSASSSTRNSIPGGGRRVLEVVQETAGRGGDDVDAAPEGLSWGPIPTPPKTAAPRGVGEAGQGPSAPRPPGRPAPGWASRSGPGWSPGEARTRWRMGRRKAAVLPLPVMADPRMSRPSRAGGRACFWIGVGSVNPIPEIPLRRSGWRPKSWNGLAGEPGVAWAPGPLPPFRASGRAPPFSVPVGAPPFSVPGRALPFSGPVRTPPFSVPVRAPRGRRALYLSITIFMGTPSAPPRSGYGWPCGHEKRGPGSSPGPRWSSSPWASRPGSGPGRHGASPCTAA